MGQRNISLDGPLSWYKGQWVFSQTTNTFFGSFAKNVIFHYITVKIFVPLPTPPKSLSTKATQVIWYFLLNVGRKYAGNGLAGPWEDPGNISTAEPFFWALVTLSSINAEQLTEEEEGVVHFWFLIVRKHTEVDSHLISPSLAKTCQPGP